MKPSKLLTVGLYNPGSLGSNHDEINVTVNKYELDFFAINETWLRPNEEG